MSDFPERGRIRVGLVIGQLSVGGAEGQLVELVRALDPGIEAYVYCLATVEGPAAAALQAAGAVVRPISGRGLSRARSLAEAVRADEIELLHSWLFIANAYAAATRFLGCRMPLITSARNCKVQSRAQQLANALAFRLSRAIVVNSRDVKEFIGRRYLAPTERVRVIHNGVDAVRFHPSATAPPTPVIVTVGRLVRQKNHELFLGAAAALSQRLPDCRFVIVGSGPLEGELKRQAVALGISGRVTFAGERHDIDEVLRGASLFWLTSLWEGMPNVVLEAMASGLPVVATDVGGVGELIADGRDGFIVPSGRRDGFVEHSAALLTDSGRWSTIGAAARARAEEFSTPRMTSALSSLYREAAAG